MKCKVQKICGGCLGFSKSMETLCQQKQEIVQANMDKHHLKVNVHPVLKAKKQTQYRNKVIVGFSKEKGKVYSGLYAPKSHRVVHSEGCLMHPPLVNAIIQTITELVHSMHIQLYNEKTRTGLLKHVLIRYAHNTEEVMVVFVTSQKIFPSRKNLIQAIVRKHPEVKTILQNVNPRKTSIVLENETFPLYGNGTITDILGNQKITFGPSSFYQIHSWQCEELYELGHKLLNPSKNDILLDTYCGVGTIGLSMARYCKKVYGVEINPDAIVNAKQNAKQNHVSNIQFIANDSTRFMTQAKRKRFYFDGIILDPPRAGTTVPFIKAACELNPKKILYISCDPTTFGRDLLEFKKQGYLTDDVYPVDMFPYTEHVETVCLLSKRDWLKPKKYKK